MKGALILSASALAIALLANWLGPATTIHIRGEDATPLITERARRPFAVPSADDWNRTFSASRGGSGGAGTVIIENGNGKKIPCGATRELVDSCVIYPTPPRSQ